MRKLGSLHTKRLIARFDAEADLAIERDIEHATFNITKLFRHAENELWKLAGGKQNRASTDLLSAEEKVRSSVQHAMARKLQNLSTAFRRSQKDYLRRLKAQKEGLGEDFDFLDKSIKKCEVGGMGMGGQPLDSINEAQLVVLEQTEQSVKERDVEIRNIVKSIEELNVIFKELAVLVIDQGTVLDRIDFNMEQVVESTTVGVEQLREAEEKHKNSTPRKCIGVLLVLITIMLIILVMKYTR